MNRLINTFTACMFCVPPIPPTPPPTPVVAQEQAIPVAQDAVEVMIADRVPSDYSLTDGLIEENQRLKDEIQRLNGIVVRSTRLIERLKLRIRELEQR